MECPFCNNFPEKQIIYKNEHVFCIANHEPLNNGHLMVLPVRHVTDLNDFNEKEAKEIFFLLGKLVDIIKENFENHPIVFLNTGKWSTKEHIHFHVLPAPGGLRHFMTALDKNASFRKRATAEELNEVVTKFKQLFKSKK